jgi:hypothetical protein
MRFDHSHKKIGDLAADRAVASLDAWFDTMRSQKGYCGPVSHWWQQSLLFTGPGFDWRYEGIISGYLSLWTRTGEKRWLQKASRAGQDLIQAQLPDGHFPESAFEINPSSGGTPHEAAADLGLLNLARELKNNGDGEWEIFFSTAVKNLNSYYLELLWDDEYRSFRDHPSVVSFVPNKAATACEALFIWSELTGDARWISEFSLPNLDRILAFQINKPGRLYGAIAQNSIGSKIIEKYMPYYISRCVPALVQGYELSGLDKYLEGALTAMSFVSRQMNENGSLLPVLYPNGQANHYPAWVSGLGDVLRAGEQLMPFGFDVDLSPMEERLLAGQDKSGGIQTATGFSAQIGGDPGGLPDFRDILHVVGWCDKAFRFLAGRVSGSTLPVIESQPYKAECVLHGMPMLFSETPDRIEVTRDHEVIYLWVKGEQWARQANPVFWLH